MLEASREADRHAAVGICNVKAAYFILGARNILPVMGEYDAVQIQVVSVYKHFGGLSHNNSGDLR